MMKGNHPSMADTIAAKRAALADKWRNGAGPLPPSPLSFGQERLWFLDQLESNSALYNVPTLLRLRGTLAVEALQQALYLCQQRHETLRTRFVSLNDTPMQLVEARAELKLVQVDLTRHPEADREAEARRLVRSEVNRPFDLRTAPLMRGLLLRLDADQHWLILTLHHIVADEWSLNILFRELEFFYTAAASGNESRLPKLAIQYADYSAWQRQWLTGTRLQSLLAYWKEELGGNAPMTELLTDKPRPATPSFRGAERSRLLNPELTGQIVELAKKQETTLFMTLQAALATLLHRYTGQDELTVASPIAGRTRAEIEPLIGFFVNTLLFRSNVADNPNFLNLLGRIRETTLGAYAHQDLPFEKLVEHLRPERSLDHLPFTRVMFVLQNQSRDKLDWPGLSVEFLPVRTDTAKFDLTLVARETGQGLLLSAEYRRELFEAATIEQLLESFQVLLEGIIARPQRPVLELPLLTPAQEDRLLVEWNQTQSDYPRQCTVHQVFEAQVARTPSAPAVVYGGRSLSYSELNHRANQLAHYLRRLKIGPDVPVGVALEPSEELIVGLLGILKAGGAYVPLDPGYPGERLQFMLRDTGAPVVLTRQGLLSRFTSEPTKVVCLDSDWEMAAKESRENPAGLAEPENLAYIMYTSGSTGQPKGVAVPHRAINRLVLNTDFIHLGARDRLAQISNVSFDAATFEIWGALLNGGQLVGISPEVLLSPRLLGRALREQKITAMFLTAALFNQLAAEAPGSLAGVGTVLAGGEALDPKWVRSVLREGPPERLLNGYGPTENTTFTCCYRVQELNEGAVSVPIGRPIANTQVYILDRHRNPVPSGVAGELYAGGDGLARGYWNRPELTAERFVSNPFIPGQKLYKTGDLARYRTDGTIEFLGRIDQQVKIRGFRVELGELETVLSSHPGVKECVTRLWGESAANRRLLAYFVPAGPAAPNTSELRNFLSRKLPEFMLPAAFIHLEKLPLTPNGKVDRKALPAPEQARPELEKQYTAPRTEAETQMVQIWESVLGVRPIGVEDKFFELGGHSFLAVRLLAQVEKVFGKKLRLATVFQAPTVAQLCVALHQDQRQGSSGTSVVEIQAKGSLPPLFLVHGAGGGMFWGYVNLARRLGPEQPVYGFKSRGLEGEKEHNSIEEMAAAYLADLRRVQPQGPYYLGGYCFGGVVAYEMARQLAEINEEVGLLALFNCSPPNSTYTRIPWTGLWWLRLLRNLLYWVTYVWSWSRPQRREFFRWKWRLLKKRLRGSARGQMPPGVEPGDLVDLSAFDEEQRKMWEAHVRALVQFHPRPYPGRVHLFRSPGHPLWCSFDPDYGWRDLAKAGVTVTVVSGAHEKILEEPCVQALAVSLSEVLNRGRMPQPPKRLDSLASLQPPAPDAGAAATNSGNGSSEEHAGCLESANLVETARPAIPSAGLGPRSPVSGPSTYVECFVRQALQTPSGKALRFAGQEVSYAELNQRSNQLAHYLQTLGVGPEVLVAVCLERTPELMAALLGVWKAGGAYLPLDPTYPTERLNYMLADSRAPLLLTQQNLAGVWNNGGRRMVCLDDPLSKAAIDACAMGAPAATVTADTLAYVIYTSGSTGAPKGVEVTHRSLLNHNLAVARLYGLQPVDRVLQFTPLSFDISVEEIFPTWLRGATLVLRTDELISTPERFLEFVAQEQITVLNLPTAYWHELTDYLDRSGSELPHSVRLMIIGGEKASETAYAKWKQCVGGAVMLMNAYGATEATVTSTVFTAVGEEAGLPIGRPIANTQVVLLTDRLEPVPPGEQGELYLGGAGLARGYRHRPELTAQRFIPNPFKGQVDSPRLYKTGDLARLRPDGNFEFLGRVDEQVKLRGFRIEVGEIESVLAGHPGVKEAVVLAREDAPGQKRLVGYYVERPPHSPGFNELLSYLKKKLPAYMVPAGLVRMTSLPMTPAGKVDRRALPMPGNARPVLEQEFAPAQSPLEEKLAQMLSEVLGVQPIGRHDNFFDLGGHSLAATQILSRIRETLQCDVSLGDFLAHPTVAELAAFLRETGCPIHLEMRPALLDSARRLPLSLSQQRLWVAEQFYKGRAPHNRPVGIRLSGPLNLEALNQSLAVLAARHTALRAVFPAGSGEPLQYICEPAEVAVPMLDFSSVPQGQRERQAMARLEQESRRPYVGTHQVLRPVLARLGPDEHWLLLVLHELAVDGRSVRLLLRELATLYGQAAAEGIPEVVSSPAQYEEVVARGAAVSVKQEQQCQYWLEQLAGVPPVLELPADHPRPAQRNGEGARMPLTVPPELVARLEEVSRRDNCSLFVTLLSGFAVLLHRYTRCSDLVIGTVAAGAMADVPEDLVFNADNLLALRCRLEGNPTFGEVIRRMNKTTTEAMAHSEVPFFEVVRRVNPRCQPGYARVFQTALVLEPELVPESSSAPLQFQPLAVDNRTSKLDLLLHLVRGAGQVSGWIEYRNNLFEPARISRLLEHWLTLLTAAAANPEQSISTLPLMASAETTRVLVEWNQTQRPFSREQTIPGLFLAQATRTPKAEALVAGEARWTYQQLETRSRQIAAYLQRFGAGPERLVGVCLERGPDLVAALLGTMLAGAAYVPLDPGYPTERLRGIVEDARAAMLITQRKFSHLVPEGQSAVVWLEELPQLDGVSSEETVNPITCTASPENLAYVIYTSGSTGRPKGVAIEQRNAVALLHWAKETYSAEELAGVLAATSIGFDLSVFEMFAPLSWGGKIIIAENALTPSTLPAADEITLINTVPSAIRECLRLKSVPAKVRVINLAGEPLPTPLVDQIYRETAVKKVYDLYGPTETTTYSTFTLRQPGAPATIGRPLANEQVYVLDANRQPVPIGIPGELCIGGAGVARGYLHQPELTEQKFIAHPWQPGARLYCTGDLARWRADGYLEYLGRLDHQVKLRGFRIEPGEIEAVLKRHPLVREALVMVREDRPGDKRLVGYVGCPEAKPPLEELSRVAAARLPEFMVPSAYVVLEKFPLTPNGKVDRKALPPPELDTRTDGALIAGPRTDLEEQLLGIWREVLGRTKIGVQDNFFEYGGHSLLAARVISRIREQFEVELPLEALFATPTVEGLAAGLAEHRWSEQLPGHPLRRRQRPARNPLSFVQERLWFLDQLQPGSPAYHVVQAIRLMGHLDEAALHRALQSVVSRHEQLRATFHFENGALSQMVAPRLPILVQKPAADFQALAPADQESQNRQWLQALAQQPFELARGPLLRAGLARLSETEHVFALVLHHIISDGWSVALLLQELQSFYSAFAAGQPAPALPPLPIEYVDFVYWQREHLHGSVLQRELDYWTRTLTGAPPMVRLPADFAPAAGWSGKAARYTQLIPEAVARGMGQLGHREGCTAFMLHMTSLAITLEKWTGQQDLVIGTVVAGRTRREVEQVQGCFMNFLPIRAQLNEDVNGLEVLRRVRASVLEAQAHQECPFEKIVEAVNPQRGFNQNPLYNVALLLQSFPRDPFHTDQLRSRAEPVTLDAALLDLRFEIEDTPEGAVLACEYRTDLFTPATIQQVVAGYLGILEQLIHQPQAPLREWVLPDNLVQTRKAPAASQEKPTLAIAATFTGEPLADPLSFWLRELGLPAAVTFAPYNQLFQQLLAPDSLLSGNSRGLNVLLLRLQDWLGTDTAVAGSGAYGALEGLDRTVNEFAGALKAAAACSASRYLVCFCPASPALLRDAPSAQALAAAETRLAEELANIAGVYLLRSEELARWYPVAEYADSRSEELGHVPYTPQFFTALATAVVRKYDALNRPRFKVIALDCDQTLWSGVCGEDGPAGVRLEPGRQWLQKFLLSQREAGKLLCLCSKNNQEDALEVFARRLDMPLRREHLTAMRLNWSPKSENLKDLARELNLGLDSFIFLDDNPVECAEVRANCPEVLVLQTPAEPEELENFLQHCWAFDQLELTTEDRRRAELYQEEKKREQLRAATPSLADFVAGLDLQVTIQPMPGEQVGRVSQLTQRTNQFNAHPRRLSPPETQQLLGKGQVLTVEVRDRFGDYGVVGAIQCERRHNTLQVELFLLSCRVLGRGVEHQMLARLGQIARQQQLEWVSVHFVRTAKNKPVEEFLENVGAAFKQPLNGGFVFRFPSAFAAQVHFVPPKSRSAPVAAAATPILPAANPVSARKLAMYQTIADQASDIAAVHHRFEAEKPSRARQGETYSPPGTEMERRLCVLWQELLRIERVGIDDDFFKLGGHSLLAVRLFAEIEKSTGRKLPLVTVFQAPTVKALAEVLCREQATQSDSLLVPIQPHGAKPPLFLVHGAGGDVLWGYANLAVHLPPDQPVYGIKSRGQLGLKEPDNLEEMARLYLEAVRAHQPQGPYYLGGYCFGGNVAYEMARQLQFDGQRVALVALLDSAPSNAGYETVTWWRPDYAWRFARNAAHWLRDFAALSWGERHAFVRRKARALGRKFKSRCFGSAGSEMVDLEEVIDTRHFPETELKLWQAHLQALVRHVDQAYIGRVTLLRTQGQPLFCSLQEDFCWGSLALGGVTINYIPGSHENIFIEPNVQDLGRALAAALAEAQLGSEPTSVPSHTYAAA